MALLAIGKERMREMRAVALAAEYLTGLPDLPDNYKHLPITEQLAKRVLDFVNEELAAVDALLVATQKECISGFYEDEKPTFRQGYPEHEIESCVTAEEVTGYVNRIAELLKGIEEVKKGLAGVFVPTHRHISTGAEYAVIGEGRIKIAIAIPEVAWVDGVFYKDKDGKLYGTSVERFQLRFQPLPGSGYLPLNPDAAQVVNKD